MYGTSYGAAIGAGAHVEYSGTDSTEVGAPVDGITITGGTVTTLNEFTAAAIGGNSGTCTNLKITGGSILLTRFDDRGQAIGSGYLADPIYPTNGAATPKNVYAITLPNPDGKDIYIDGVKWTPSNHTALDSTDTNLYAYISGEKHVIKIGSDEVVWHFDSAAETFLKTDCVDTIKDHFCDYCGEKLSEHEGGQATCTEKAVCTYCGQPYGDEPSHSYAPCTAKAATCTAKGWNAYVTCSRCDDTTYQEIPALRHDYVATVTEPTCTATGYTTNTCSRCGDSFVNSLTAMLPHNYVDGYCTGCGAEEPKAPVCPTAHFTDCPESWYHEALDFVSAQGLMNGVSATKFEPEEITTRAMVVTVLYRLCGAPAVNESAAFTDVPAGQWYSDAIAWAQDFGIVNGVSETEFEPDEPVTREQLAAILWRFECKQSEREKAAKTAARSNTSVSDWAVEAMDWAIAQGLFVGNENGELNPLDNATRAEYATIIMRYLGGSYDCPEGK